MHEIITAIQRAMDVVNDQFLNGLITENCYNETMYALNDAYAVTLKERARLLDSAE